VKVSVVIRTRDEAPRLRLTLASLEGQDALHEIVIADDGSSDDTPAVIADAAARLPIRSVRHQASLGRSAASNAAAGLATGDILLFLDGDTLLGPDAIVFHRAAHRWPDTLVRGETWHLRCTRFLADPALCMPWPDKADGLARLPPSERDLLRVTEEQVRGNFAAVAARASPGVYPGAGPRALFEEEMEAIERASPQSWAAASGSNFSIPRALFLAARGFDPEMDINEHRELAYRLCRAGARMLRAGGARSYHLTHRERWRDPLFERAWQDRFAALHPDAPLEGLVAYWSGFAAGRPRTRFFQ